MSDLDGLDELLRRFEAGALPLEAWHHREHLRVAFRLLTELPFEAALSRLRAGIQRFNARHGIELTLESGYHETITRLFAARIAALLDDRRERPRAEQLALVEAELGDFRAVVRRHYSRERILSWEARRGWVPPDLEPLPPDRDGPSGGTGAAGAYPPPPAPH